MRRWSIVILLLLLVYLATGFYVVKGNEQVVVRRFGRIVTRDGGTVRLQSSGLHYDLPWPFSQLNRVNLNEVRTLSIGSVEQDDVDATAFLETVDGRERSQFLTGDKNVLNVQINVQYRISASGVREFLFDSESAERHLRYLVEAAAVDLIGRSGVDFVHPLGLGELRELLTRQVRRLVEQHQLGIEVEEVTIAGVAPPIRVKADFLDVSNARADREQYINAARAYQEQREAAGWAEDQRIQDGAEIFATRTTEEARGKADSFVKLIDQFEADEAEGIQSYVQARQMALQRRYVETMEEIFSNVAGKVFLDSGKPIDLTIFRDPKE